MGVKVRVWWVSQGVLCAKWTLVSPNNLRAGQLALREGPLGCPEAVLSKALSGFLPLQKVSAVPSPWGKPGPSLFPSSELRSRYHRPMVSVQSKEEFLNK